MMAGEKGNRIRMNNDKNHCCSDESDRDVDQGMRSAHSFRAKHEKPGSAPSRPCPGSDPPTRLTLSSGRGCLSCCLPIPPPPRRASAVGRRVAASSVAVGVRRHRRRLLPGRAGAMPIERPSWPAASSIVHGGRRAPMAWWGTT